MHTMSSDQGAVIYVCRTQDAQMPRDVSHLEAELQCFRHGGCHSTHCQEGLKPRCHIATACKQVHPPIRYNPSHGLSCAAKAQVLYDRKALKSAIHWLCRLGNYSLG